MSYRTMTRSSVALNVKFLDTAKGTFTGLGAVFGNLDYNGDIIERGAFATTLREAKARKSTTQSPFLLPLLWMHDEKMPCGGISDAYETAQGLVIECQCDLNTELGRTAFSGIQQGYANGLSIGYNTIKSASDNSGNRKLLEIKLWEVSVITAGYAANPLALADSASAKSRGGMRMNRSSFNPWGLPPRLELQNMVAYPDPPERKDFSNEREYENAIHRYLAKKLGTQTESTRIVDKGEAKEHETGYAQNVQGMAEIQTAVVQQRAQRVANGTATLAEKMAEYKRTGRTPDGRELPDYGAAIQRGYEVIYARLRGDLPPAEE